MTKINQEIHITGIVQGVGFRPYVYNLAEKFGLTGWVRNTSHGVDIEISGEIDQIKQFTSYLSDFPPPLAQIDTFSTQSAPLTLFSDFKIIDSVDRSTDFLPISPDISICDDCRRELFDPNDRRFRYPFINCTNCGPRFTITKNIPYDRPNTSMAGFIMCPDCQTEYQNPKDRRFHAQPIACPVCGPKIWLEIDGKRIAEKEKALQLTRDLIKQGKIIAVKGLGGFHLACDAFNASSLQLLRNRKLRSDKPFALMAFDIEQISHFAEVDQYSKELLTSPQSPIVLLPPTEAGKALLALCAPSQNKLGFFLPYTPLHLLLLEPSSDFPKVLVMTSANISEEPIAYKNEDAHSQLKNLADAFLMHDRPIVMRVDDSVYSMVEEKPYPIRRARGFAPNPLRLPMQVPSILGTGPLQKNTFCLSRKAYAFVSHYIGDLENYETLESYESAIEHYKSLFRIKPEIIACDLHPDYLSTKYAKQLHETENIPLCFIQHHHAHIASCLAENQWNSSDPVIGLSYDGTGYGTDGHIWGGEILIASYKDFNRSFHLKEIPMPGGDLAVKNPLRMALSYLIHSDIDFVEDFLKRNSVSQAEYHVIYNQILNKINTPLTTSMGRLFDAVASLTGLRQKINYDAQAAIELESIVDSDTNEFYDLPLEGNIIQTSNLIKQIVNDIKNKVTINEISAKFHNAIIQVSLEACQLIYKETGLKTVALSGGVWQNLYLTKKMLVSLRQAGFKVLSHQKLPPNDSCVSLGQIMVAAHKSNL